MTAKTKNSVTAGCPARTKPVAAPTPTAQAPTAKEQFLVERAADESLGLRVAKLAIGSIAPSALTAKTYAKGMFGPMTMNDSFEALSSGARAVHAGDLSQTETMLFSQASALNAIFSQLALRAHGQERIQHLEGERPAVPS